MNDQRFDDLARRLAASTSRRSVVKAVGAGIAGLFLSAVGRERATADTGDPGTGGNSDCAHFCHDVFVGEEAGDCTSQAAHGTGPCFVCGPSAPAGAPQACGVGTSSAACCPATTPTCCGNTTCVNLQTDVNNCGTCGHKCATGQVCTKGTCVTPAATCPSPGIGQPCPSNSRCFCNQEAGDAGVCVCNTLCSTATHCTTNADCPPGTVCTPNTSCGAQGICAIACSSTTICPFVPSGAGSAFAN